MQWVKTMHERAQYVDVTYTKADMQLESAGGREHKHLRCTEEQCVEKNMTAKQSFLNLFAVSD